MECVGADASAYYTAPQTPQASHLHRISIPTYLSSIPTYLSSSHYWFTTTVLLLDRSANTAGFSIPPCLSSIPTYLSSMPTGLSSSGVPGLHARLPPPRQHYLYMCPPTNYWFTTVFFLTAGSAIAVAYLAYMLGFHLLANLPLDQPLYLGVHVRFWMQARLL